MLGPILCGLLAQAPLLPKLRGHFAEFLGNASSAGLRILSSSTCVGLRYGHTVGNSGFSRRLGHGIFATVIFAPHHVPESQEGFSSPAVLPAWAGLLSRLSLPLRVPAVLPRHGTGISTCCPSTTSFDLALGPDLPRADQLYSGNLRYSADGILTHLSLLIPAFSLFISPLLLSVQLLRYENAPLPIIL